MKMDYLWGYMNRQSDWVRVVVWASKRVEAGVRVLGSVAENRP